MVVQLDLGEYAGKESGIAMKESQVLYIEIPRQMKDQQEADAVDSAGSGAGDTIIASFSFNFVISLALGQSMDILWSAVENLQVVQLTQMLDVKTPGSVAKYLDFFDEVTSVEILDTEAISEKLMFIPDVDSFSLNF